MSGITERLRVAIADRYVIERELGQGGMATVYLAQDLKHKRHVALKVLRPELAAVLGAERFLQEITTTAQLQHPHILPLFDSGQAEGFLYYVMPYIEGETLRGKLNRETQLGIDEAVSIAVEVADALDYAHQHGVIHRDIKPENILLQNGRPMVADFGIALAVSAAAGGRMTETGLSLGTPHYMSPEQATAEKEITARSDVYSLGSVLYELLTGSPPHVGASAQQIIMKIVTEEAQPVTQHRKSVPPHVAAATAKAIEKLPADRFESARAFADALKNPAFTAATASASALSTRPRVHASMLTRALVALLALVSAVAAWGWMRQAPPVPVARYGLALPPGQEVLLAFHPSFAVAPDGSFIVYDAITPQGSQRFLKPRDRYEATPIAGTESSGQSPATGPAVSPDGNWIVFTVMGQLRKVPRTGGSAVTLADSVDMSVRGVAWLDDGTIIYRDAEMRLRRLPEAGGTAEVVWVPPDPGVRAVLPTPLPGARGVLFIARPATAPQSDLWVLDLRNGEAKLLVAGVAQGWYTPTGHLVYVRPDGGAFGAPFDLNALSLTGQAIPLFEGVRVSFFGVPAFAVAPSGTVVMATGPTASGTGALFEAIWVARDGAETRLDTTWSFNSTGNSGWSLSPNGRYLAIKLTGETGDDIWVKELPAGPLARLTVDPADEFRPRWSPDGRTVAFMSTRGDNEDAYTRRADGTLPAELLADLDGPIFEALWSRDARWLVLRTGGFDGNRDIWVQQLGVDSVPRLLLATDFDERAVALSPDGRWLAYQSDETGREEVYIRPFPAITDGKWTISLNGGTGPLWSHSGRELFYVDPASQRLTAAQVRAGPGGIEVTERRPLFEVGSYLLSSNYTPFDIAPDDRRFLMVRQLPTVDEVENAIVVIEHWFEELKARVGQ